MRKIRLSSLRDIDEGHVLKDILPGQAILSGGLSFSEPNARSHTNDGPGGEDYHVHDNCEAFIIMQGKGALELDKIKYPVTTGDVIIVEPGEDHHLISDSDMPLVTLWCHAGD